MPIYEFRCNSCQRKSSIFTKHITSPSPGVCPNCGSKDLVRLISGFAYHKSGKARLEEAGEPSLHPGPDYYKDPRNIGRYAEKMLGEAGMEMPHELGEKIGKAREGDVSALLERE